MIPWLPRTGVVLSGAMSKLLAVLMIVLVQFQPLSGALLCEQHQMDAASMPMPGTGHHHTAPTPDHTPLHTECPFMSTCTATAPAPVPVLLRILEWQPVSRARFTMPTTHPTDVVAPPPVHPPSA